MPRTQRRPLAVAATLALLLVLGWLAAGQVGAALGISAQPHPPVVEREHPVPERAAAPAPEVAVIALPDPADPALGGAARILAGALAERTGRTPAVVAAASAEGASADVTVALDLAGAGPEAYRVDPNPSRLRVSAADPRGGAYGLLALADAVRSGRDPAERAGAVVEPRLGLRLVDAGAVGVVPDPTAWLAQDDYSHNSRAFADAILPDAPYVDAAALAAGRADLEAYVDHVLAAGYNGIVVKGFLEYLEFSGVGDGDAVYPPGSEHRERAKAMRTSFGPLWKYAHDRGLKVFLNTDMLALTTPLEDYLVDTVGSLDTEDPRLWDVYRAGVDELLTQMPYVDGVMIRIGEAGAIYDLPGWDYYSSLAVKTPAAVRAMLDAFTAASAQHGKDVIFRTWSVGVGEVGAMHTDPASYAAVLDGVDAPNLIVSTKYSLGDFYSHLPLNDTLEIGAQRRIVEFQGRREFEAYGSLPNALGDLHQQALQRFLAANPRVEGVWNWTQDGGPWRAGPMSLYLKAGFWQLYDLNTAVTGRLAWDPDADVGTLTGEWIRATLSDDPATVQAIGEALALSREAVAKGLYIGPYAEQQTRALGLEPPPMLWIFEWDIVTGDSAALGSIYSIARDDLGRALDESGQAVDTARRMRDLVAGTDPATWRSPELRQRFVDTLDYEVDLFETLGAYRAMALRHEQWLDTGDTAAGDAWRAARAAYVEARDAHLARYTGDLDLPAYDLEPADIGLARADRDRPMAWLARLLLAALVVLLALGSAPGQRLLGHGGRQRPGAAALRALWLGLTRPWRLTEAAAGDRPAPGRLDRVLVWALPAAAVVASRAAFTWFLAPAHLVVVLGSWLAFVAVLRLAVRGRDPWLLWAGVGGAAILRTVLLLAALGIRGPGRYWLVFWTEPAGRTAYLTVGLAAFGWVLVVAAWALHDAYGRPWRAAIGSVLGGCAAVLLGVAALLGAVGMEQALTTWNDQMSLLPLGLSRILGITVYLGIPAESPVYVAAAGFVLLAVAGLLVLSARWVRRPAA